MPHVFISYVRENGDIVDRLATDLKSRGVMVWLDRNDIEPGARWRDAIKNAIRGGKFFIACFSSEYVARDRSYMNEELTLAIDELRARPSNRIWFIPILINDTAIPSRPISHAEDLSDIQAVKLYENWIDGVRRILRVLKHDDQVSARINYLLNILEQPFHIERLHALEQLRDLGPAAGEAIPVLVKTLKDQDEVARGLAAAALGSIGPTPEAIPALVEALKDRVFKVRELAAIALNGIDLPPPLLAAALQHQDAEVRIATVWILTILGPIAVPTIAMALKDQDTKVRQQAASKLGGMGPAAAEAVPALIEALKDQGEEVRRSAASALGSIGPVAVEAIPALVKTLKDQDEGARRFAAFALAEIGLAAVPALVEAAKDQDAEVGRSAASALESIRRKS